MAALMKLALVFSLILNGCVLIVQKLMGRSDAVKRASNWERFGARFVLLISMPLLLAVLTSTFRTDAAAIPGVVGLLAAYFIGQLWFADDSDDEDLAPKAEPKLAEKGPSNNHSSAPRAEADPELVHRVRYAMAGLDRHGRTFEQRMVPSDNQVCKQMARSRQGFGGWLAIGGFASSDLELIEKSDILILRCCYQQYWLKLAGMPDRSIVSRIDSNLHKYWGEPPLDLNSHTLTFEQYLKRKLKQLNPAFDLKFVSGHIRIASMHAARVAEEIMHYSEYQNWLKEPVSIADFENNVWHRRGSDFDRQCQEILSYYCDGDEVFAYDGRLEAGYALFRGGRCIAYAARVHRRY